MSNPDVPGIKACERLAKARRPRLESARLWWARSARLSNGDRKNEFVITTGDDVFGSPHYPAPTIGEMLDYIRRRGWFTIHRVLLADSGARRELWAIYSDIACSYGHQLGYKTDERHADALAFALSEALEKENTK